MLKTLFSSSARVRVLHLFLMNSEREYYQRQIKDITHLPVMAVQRELKKLTGIGLLKKKTDGNRVYYYVNKKFSILPELKGIIMKTVGVGEGLRVNLQNTGDIELAFVYGSYARNMEDMESDIDLFVVGDISSRTLSGMLSKIARFSGREINYVLYSKTEFAKKARKNHFVTSVLKEPKIFLRGDEDDIKRLTAGG